MKTEDFVFAMNETADKFITEPFEEAKERKIIRFRKWAAVAACICLVLASATVVAAEVFDIGFNLFREEIDYTVENFNGEKLRLDYVAEKYELKYDVDFYSPDSFGPMEDMKKGIDSQTQRIMYASEISDPAEREKFIERNGYSAVIDVYGEHFYEKFFGNVEKAFECLGSDIFEFPDYGLNHKNAVLTLHGYSSDELTGLEMTLIDKYVDSETEPNIVLSYSARVHFAESDWQARIEFTGNEGDTFTSERYNNKNGNEYLVVRCRNAEGNTTFLRAFLIKNDIIYEASMYDGFGDDDIEKYEDFIHNWANFY